MPEPLDFQIIKAVQAALGTIAVASGYYFTIASTVVKLDPNVAVETFIKPGGARPFMVIEIRDDDFAFIEKPDGISHKLPLALHWVGASTPTDDDSRLQTFLRGCADVERALNAARPTLHGLFVYDAIIRGRKYHGETDGAEVWAELDFPVDIHRQYGYPVAGQA